MRKVPIVLGFFLLIFTASCQENKTDWPFIGNKLVNPAHLNFLFEPVIFKGDSAGIIRIYSEYPDYRWVGDEDEGIACVDDAARAAVFYQRYYRYSGSRSAAGKALLLCRFLLGMQGDSGYFLNFIYPDHSINLTHRNSEDRPDWWSWRALWALAECYPLAKETDGQLAADIHDSIEKLLKAVRRFIPRETEITQTMGISHPRWLPYEAAADQASVLLLGITTWNRLFPSAENELLMNRLADGIVIMQAGDEKTFPYGAFLSWKNLWHGWGNCQAWALLNLPGDKIRQEYRTSALREVNGYYPHLLQSGMLNEFSLIGTDNRLKIESKKHFPQIAYELRPMILAALQAAEISGDTNHPVLAGKLAGWFFGANAARRQMYDPQTGRCFDGIISEEKINRNSGAESTIEALLALLAVEQHPVALKALQLTVKNNTEE